MEVTFRRTPGIVWDLSRFLMMKLNDESKWMNQITRYKTKEKDLIYIRYLLSQLEDPNPLLAPFFYMKDAESECYFTDLFINMINERGADMSKQDFIDYLSNRERVLRELCLFYFGDDECYHDMAWVTGKLCEQKNLGHDVIFQIVRLYMNLDEAMEDLVTIFDQYFDQVLIDYELRANELIERQEMLDLKKLCSFVDTTGGVKRRGRKPYVHNCVVSFVLLNKWTWWQYTNDVTWALLGEQYEPVEIITPPVPVNIVPVGSALADPSRKQIVEMIVEYGPLSTFALSELMNMSVNTIVYHLEVLKHSHLMKYLYSDSKACYGLKMTTCSGMREQLVDWKFGTEMPE